MLLIAFLLTTANAQDPPDINTAAFMKAEIATLHLKVAGFDQWVTALKARIGELEADKAALQNTVTSLKTKCGDRCEK